MGIDVNDRNFKEEVLDESLPVLVDFWAVWCGPCLRFAPIIQQIADEYKGKLKICKLDIDRSPESTSFYDIMGVPTVLIFKNGKVSDRVTGAISKKDLEEIIKKYVISGG